VLANTGERYGFAHVHQRRAGDDSPRHEAGAGSEDAEAEHARTRHHHASPVRHDCTKTVTDKSDDAVVFRGGEGAHGNSLS
jgi:hypothetical protein